MSTFGLLSNFNLQRINQGETQIVSLSGRMDHDAFCRVHKELADLLQQNHRCVILDLALITSATTMSLARLLVCGREFRRHGGQLKLAGLSPFLSHLAQLAGFDRQTDFEPNVAAALKAMTFHE